MFGLDSDIGGSALRLWVAAGSAALLVFVCALAFDWTRTRTVARVSVVVVGALLGATLAWAFLNGAAVRDQSAERRALEARATALNVQVLAPGSPLACLDGLAGDNVEAACERALFATPASVATATTYVAARLSLLADMTTYTKRGGGNIDGALLPLRRALQSDRFGFVAHMLAMRDGCSSDNCQALALLQDPGKVRANLNGQTLDRYLDHYLTAWGQTPGVPVADATPTGAVSGDPAAPPRKSALNIDFPSADSIPAVSIMNPEPKGGVPTPSAAEAAVTAGAQSSARVVGIQQMPPMPGAPPTSPSSKTKRKQAANPPAPAGAPGAPQTAASAPPADPVWSAGATLASPQGSAGAPPSAANAAQRAAPSSAAPPPAAAPASTASSAGVPLAGMPVQLNPFTSPQGNGSAAAQ
jgi:hypothetical protein